MRFAFHHYDPAFGNEVAQAFQALPFRVRPAHQFMPARLSLPIKWRFQAQLGNEKKKFARLGVRSKFTYHKYLWFCAIRQLSTGKGNEQPLSNLSASSAS